MSERERTKSGEAFLRLVLEPQGITLDVLTGKAVPPKSSKAYTAMAAMTGTSIQSWEGMDYKDE